MRKSLAAATAEETEQIGALLSAALPAGDALKVVYLTGDLGAGKTTLARGFLREAGVTGAVKSPTYTLVETYRAGARRPASAAEDHVRAASGEGGSADVRLESASPTFVHLDLYRLIEPSELENLGLRDWAMPGHVWLVEWPERGTGHLPPADLVVRLAGGEPAHVIEIEAESVLGEEWVTRLPRGVASGT